MLRVAYSSLVNRAITLACASAMIQVLSNPRGTSESDVEAENASSKSRNSKTSGLFMYKLTDPIQFASPTKEESARSDSEGKKTKPIKLKKKLGAKRERRSEGKKTTPIKLTKKLGAKRKRRLGAKTRKSEEEHKASTKKIVSKKKRKKTMAAKLRESKHRPTQGTCTLSQKTYICDNGDISILPPILEPRLCHKSEFPS